MAKEQLTKAERKQINVSRHKRIKPPTLEYLSTVDPLASVSLDAVDVHSFAKGNHRWLSPQASQASLCPTLSCLCLKCSNS